MTVYRYLFSDLPQTTLAVGITSASTSLQVVGGGGSQFPALGTAQAFLATIQRISGGTVTAYETVMVTARSGDNFTGIVRNIAGTNQAWNAGDTVTLLIPAVALNSFVQPIQAQAQSYNYAQDIGAANAYKVALNPVLNGRTIGMPIRFLARNDCTGDSTFDDGSGAGPAPIRNLTRAFGHSALYPKEISAGKLTTLIWDGTYFQLDSPRVYFDLIAGSIDPTQVPLAAVLQWESSLAIGFNQLVGQILQSQIAASLNLPGNPTAGTRSIGDSTNGIANTAFVNPGSVLGSYRKHPDGSITQRGVCNPNGGTITVTFPIAFPNAVDAITFGQISGGATQVWVPTSGTVSRFSFPVANSGGQTYWEAQGH